MVLHKLLRLCLVLLLFGAPLMQAALPKEVGTSEAEKFIIKSQRVQLSDGTVLPSRDFVIERKADRYMPNMFIIKTKSNYGQLSGSASFPDGMIQSAIQDLGIKNIITPMSNFKALELSDNNTISNIHEVYYDAPVDPFDVCRQLMSNPQIEYASPVYIRKTFESPNDPRSPEQYVIEEMNLEAAWDIQKGNAEVTIAIVDSGVEITHDDLQENIWTNPNEIANDGEDNDNNGKIDDIHGWDLVGNTTSQQMSAGQWQEDNNPTPPVSTGSDHGTHVAGCAAAVTNNSTGVASPGYNCSIIPVKCGLDESTGGVYRGYAGIAYAADLGADVINCSWGGLGSSAYEQDVINYALENGSVVVTSSGNESSYTDLNPTYPSSYDNVLNVGATKAGKKIASFTNYGREVTVYAPGDEILSTQLGGGYSKKSGTSMASPIVSGLAALVKAQHLDWTPKQIIHQIRGTSANVLAPEMQSMFFGLADAGKALAVNPNLADGVNRIPGLEITDISNGSNSRFVFTETQTQPITFVVHNYLAKSLNTRVELIPLEPYLSVNQSTFTLPDIRPGFEEQINTEITLDKSNPWFDGFVQLLVKFEADNYINYQLIKLDIELESSNNFTALTTTPLSGTAKWNDISSSDAQSFWLAGSLYGYYGYYVAGSNSSGWESGQMDIPIYAAAALSSTSSYLGGTSYQGDSKIYKTNDMGQNWDENDVTSMTSFINGLHFWSETDGIFFGDPIDGAWGIATSMDGGDTWTQRSAPAPLTSETGLVQCTFVKDDYCYFGTTLGRVYVSSNKGRKWTAYNLHLGGVITFLAFSDSEHGIAVYKEKSDSDVTYLASTEDGGATWNKKVYNFTEHDIVPINVFNPAESDQLLVVSKNGEILFTENLGQTFNVFLNGRFYQSDLAALSSSNGSARLWNVGSYITSTDFTYKPENAVRALELTQNTLDYGDLDTGKVKSKTLNMTSVGNYRVEIDSVKIAVVEGDESEFTLTTEVPQYLEVGAKITVRVKFSPTTVGTKKAVLTFYSDSKDATIEVELLGNATEVLEFTKVIDVIDEYNFGEVDLGKDSTSSISISNLGNSDLKITSLSLVGSDKANYSVVKDNLPMTIAEGEAHNIEVTFTPKSEGNKMAVLSIVSDADNGAQQITLNGMGNDPNSIFESPYGVLEVSNYPNPAQGMTNIDFILPNDSYVNLNLFDVNGRFIGTIYRNQASQGKNSVRFSTENIATGLYFIEIQFMGKRYIHKLNVAR